MSDNNPLSGRYPEPNRAAHVGGNLSFGGMNVAANEPINAHTASLIQTGNRVQAGYSDILGEQIIFS